MAKLRHSIYDRPTLEVAGQLLGKVLVHDLAGKRLAGRIVETEAYIGVEDRACHASWRRRQTCEALWGPAGTAYVYLSRGIHWMLNIVTEKDNFPAAVLIRALEPRSGIAIMKLNRGKERLTDLTSGPGKLTQALGISGKDNNLDLTNSSLWIEEGTPPKQIKTSPRIGVAYAGEWAAKPWRFFDPFSRFVSRP